MQNLSIIPIEETRNCRLDDVLSNGEIDFLAAHVKEPRKENFIAGRIASKLAYRKHDGNVDYKDLKVINDLEGGCRGKPRLFKKNNESGSVSIGHSKDLACAIYDPDTSVGLDIELVENRDQSFAKYNFTPNEKEIMKSLGTVNLDRAITALWTAKEAMSKVVGKGLNLDTKDLEIILKKKQVSDFTGNDDEKIKYQGIYKGYKLMVFDLITFKISHKNKLYYLTVAKEAE